VTHVSRLRAGAVSARRRVGRTAWAGGARTSRLLPLLAGELPGGFGCRFVGGAAGVTITR